MMNLRLAAALVGLIVGLVGCTTAHSDSAPSSPASASPPATTSSPSESPATSPEQLATAQAKEVLREYYRAQTTCLADPAKSPVTCFDQVAITTELTNMRNALVGAQQMGTKVKGDIGVVSVKRTSVNLTSNVTATPPVVPEVIFTVCTDLSDYNIVDKDGKSIVPPTRKSHVLVKASVLNYKYPDPSQWRVGLVTSVKGGTC